MKRSRVTHLHFFSLGLCDLCAPRGESCCTLGTSVRLTRMERDATLAPNSTYCRGAHVANANGAEENRMTKALLLVVFLLALTLLSCGFTNPPPTRIPATPIPTLPPGATVVELDIMNFQHADAEVKTGTVVIWTNRDKPLHTVTHIVADGNRFFNSKTIAPDAGFRFHFTEPGTYVYQCLIHPVNMKGTITVTE